MLQSLSTFSTKLILKNAPTEHLDEAAYVYGFMIFYSTLFTGTLLLLFSFIYGAPIRYFIFFLFFTPIRTYSGGFHCNTYLNCTIISIIVFTATYLLSEFLVQMPTYLTVILIISAVFYIYNNSTIIYEKNSVKEEKWRICKKKVTWILYFYSLCISFFLTNTSFYSMATMAAATLTAVAILIHIAKRRKLNEQNHLENN